MTIPLAVAPYPSRSLPQLSAPDSDLIETALTEAGCAIVHNALNRCEIADIAADVAPWFQEAPFGEGVFFGRTTRRFSGLFAKSRATARLALHPTILNAVENLLRGPVDQPHCDCIQLNLTQAIEIGPGEPPQLLHRDDNLFPFIKPFEVMINVMWPLSDFTAENGATRLAPGSHKWPRELIEQYDGSVVPAEAPPGSAILWLGSLLHGGGGNTTPMPRRGVVMSYSLAWLAPAEKLLISTPPEVARTLPDKLQALIGYQVHRPNLGWVEGRSPKEWLDGAFDTVAPASDNLTPSQQALMEAYLAQVAQ
jgi:ectoine hydroxylase-related dioxygenase (phytanoyl-CoA dioxygenase family)